jgi:hypothetical protein
MRRASFGRSLGFAGLAALLTMPCELYGSFVWGYEGSLSRYMLALVPLYALAAASGLRAKLRGALVGAGLGGMLAMLGPSPGTALLGALLSLGVARSLAFRPCGLGRALAVELGLALVSALAFAALSGRDMLGDTFAVWSFWLVQSAFALVQNAPAPATPHGRDRFEAAVEAAQRLMPGT